MSAHTSGPWVIARTSGMQIYVTQPQDRPGRAPGYYAEVRRFTANHDEVEANARLIAAAPDLLDALELILSAEDRGFGMDYVKGCARAAIAKAKGETQ